jgi:hypothetical protein
LSSFPPALFLNSGNDTGIVTGILPAPKRWALNMQRNSIANVVLKTSSPTKDYFLGASGELSPQLRLELFG